MNIEQFDQFETHLNVNIPEWMREAQVFVRFNIMKNSLEFTVYFQIHRTNWVMIRNKNTNDGEIDVFYNLRADYELPVEDAESMTLEEVAKGLWDSVYAYWSDIVLCPGDGDSPDPIWHVSDRATLLPRDAVREMILTDVDYYAHRIGQYSLFREEDWYKEWAAKQVATD